MEEEIEENLNVMKLEGEVARNVEEAISILKCISNISYSYVFVVERTSAATFRMKLSLLMFNFTSHRI